MLSHEAKCPGGGGDSLISLLPQYQHSQEELDRYRSCRNPLTFHDAQCSPAGVETNNTGWSLYEDKPGRPGWIATQKGSTLQFPVQFGDQPMLIYKNIGTANMQLRSLQKSEEKRTVLLDGRWEKIVSLLPYTEFFGYFHRLYRPLTHDGLNRDLIMRPLLWKEGKEGIIYNLEIRLKKGSKFKITWVMPC
eukprot:scaffold95494_cov35-Attheya_sp.AAC.1